MKTSPQRHRGHRAKRETNDADRRPPGSVKQSRVFFLLSRL